MVNPLIDFVDPKQFDADMAQATQMNQQGIALDQGNPLYLQMLEQVLRERGMNPEAPRDALRQQFPFYK